MRRLIFLIILCLAGNCFAIQKNVNSQKWTIFAFDRTDNTAKTGDLAQITGSIWKDGVEDVIADTNPTELAHGYYEFDLDQAESNGDYLVMDAVSSTGNIQVVGCPMAVWTTAPAINTLSIANARVNVDVTAISTDATAANNLELFTEVLENATGLIDAGTFKASAIDATAIAPAAIDNATFAADVGSTAYATNIIALAVRKTLDEIDLDHLLSVTTGVAADADLEAFVSSGTVMAHLMGIAADVTEYDATVDSMEAQGAHLDTIETDTDELQTDDYVTSIAAVQTTVDTIEDDTEKMDTAGEWDTLNATVVTAVGNIEADTENMDTAGEWDTLNATLITGVNVSSVSADAIEAGDFKTGAIDADALATDFVTEIWAKAFTDIGAGAPSATETVFVGLNRLYMAWLNKTITNGTNSEIEYYNFAGTKIAEAPISDDGTDFTKDKVAAVD